MFKLHIKESLKELDNNLFITEYVGDMVNLLINKPKPYRIIYNDLDNVYIIADAISYIHPNMLRVAINQGWLPNTKEKLEHSNMDIIDYSMKFGKNIMFLPTSEIDNAFNDQKERYDTFEYFNEYPILTGSIFTKTKNGDYYLEREIPDLYKFLKRHRYFI